MHAELYLKAACYVRLIIMTTDIPPARANSIIEMPQLFSLSVFCSKHLEASSLESGTKFFPFNS